MKIHLQELVMKPGESPFDALQRMLPDILEKARDEAARNAVEGGEQPEEPIMFVGDKVSGESDQTDDPGRLTEEAASSAEKKRLQQEIEMRAKASAENLQAVSFNAGYKRSGADILEAIDEDLDELSRDDHEAQARFLWMKDWLRDYGLRSEQEINDEAAKRLSLLSQLTAYMDPMTAQQLIQRAFG